jgi:hypothetical protein
MHDLALAAASERLSPRPRCERSARWLIACVCWFGVLSASASARVQADGAFVLPERELMRIGPDAREYCRVPSIECSTLLTKVLSSYGFLRGSVRGMITLTPSDSTPVSALGALHLDAVSAALPGGDGALASIDAVLGRERVQRIRLTLLDFENLFGCNDAQHDTWVPPVVGMTTRKCRGDSVLGLDLRMLRLQWDAFDTQFLAEWARLGPAFELLQNGMGQAHLRRSIVLAALIDVQSRFAPAAVRTSGTSLGAGLRLSALYRSPQWEARLRVVQRTQISGWSGAERAGPAGRDRRLDGELRLLRNWFVSDAMVMQAGLSFALAWSSQPLYADALFADRTAQMNLAAGLYIGWVSEAPSI